MADEPPVDDLRPSRLVEAFRAYAAAPTEDARWQLIGQVAARTRWTEGERGQAANQLASLLNDTLAGTPADETTLTTVALLDHQLRPTGEPHANSKTDLAALVTWPIGTSQAARDAALARGLEGDEAGEYAQHVDRRIRDLNSAEDARNILRALDQGDGLQVADVAAVVANLRSGLISGELPTLYPRTDRQALLYAGRTHSFFGESESYKSMAAQAACAWALDTGLTCAYLDLEDRAEGVVDRLLRLGADEERLARRFFYARLDGPATDNQRADLYEQCDTRQWSIVVVDGVTEAMAMHGLKPNDMDDVATFYRWWLTPFANTGAAAVTVDHYPKDADTKGQVGSQHKRAGITGATYKFARHRDGLAKVTVDKDRPYGVRAAAVGDTVGWLHVEGRVGEPLDVRLEPVGARTAEKPTHLMEQISRIIAAANADGLHPSAAWVTRETKGNEDTKRNALRLLVEEGHVTRTAAGNAFRHTSVTAYHADDDREEDQPRRRADIDN